MDRLGEGTQHPTEPTNQEMIYVHGPPTTRSWESSYHQIIHYLGLAKKEPVPKKRPVVGVRGPGRTPEDPEHPGW